MNTFRLLGDLSHVIAIIILLGKIWKTRSCSDISGRSQLLFAVVYTARYLDLFETFISVYNSAMKIMFIITSYGILYLIYVKFKDTYDRKNDIFQVEFLLVPTAILALLMNYSFNTIEIFWAFSIYLEAVAILPQLFMISQKGEAESLIWFYLLFLGSYRGLYILNWIYRYYVEEHYDPISVFAGIVQVILFFNFFCLYIAQVTKREQPVPAEECECVSSVDKNADSQSEEKENSGVAVGFISYFEKLNILSKFYHKLLNYTAKIFRFRLRDKNMENHFETPVDQKKVILV